MNNNIFKLLLVTIVFSFPTLTNANSTVESSSTTSFNFDHPYTSSDTENRLFFSDVDIESLKKFDSSLGSLESISVTASIEFSSKAYIFGDDPGGMASGNVTGFSRFDISLLAWNSDLQKGSFFIRENAFFDDLTLCDSFSHDGCEGSQVNSDSIEITRDISNLASTGFNQFIGSGDLAPDTLTLGVIYPESLAFFLEFTRVDIASVNIDIEADITVTYGYSPVPLPGALWLLLSSTGLLLGFTRQRSS